MFWGRDHRILRTLLAGGAFLVGLGYAAVVESWRAYVVGSSRLDDAVFLHSFPVRRFSEEHVARQPEVIEKLEMIAGEHDAFGGRV